MGRQPQSELERELVQQLPGVQEAAPLERCQPGMSETVEQIRLVESPHGARGSSEETAQPLRSVRIGERLASAHYPWPLDGLQKAVKKLTWTALEARLLRSPIRYTMRELLTHRQGDYALRNGESRFSVRHRSGDIDIFRKFYAYGYYDLPEEVQARLRSLDRAVNVLDLGANIGFFEVFTRDRLPIGRVVCFEPDPANAAVLERVRTANGADWEIVRACASNQAGTVRFNTGRKNFSRIDAGGDADTPALDVFPRIAEADLVKMNIEGSEWEILQDPRLAQTSASWIVEYHRIAHPDADIHTHIRELFERAGYNVRLAAKVRDNGLVWAWKA
jgi:FkbM family methyltransferase